MASTEPRVPGKRTIKPHEKKSSPAFRALGIGAAALLVAGAVGTLFLEPPRDRAAHEETTTVPAQTLRLGYFANVTHAPALIANERGLLERALEADGTDLVTEVFNAGPAAIEALNSGALDATYIGPNPSITSYLSSEGQSLRIVAGVTYGGASLVVSEDITSIEDLVGSNLATPQFGGTQDVALRHFLKDRGMEAEVTVTPSSNGTVPQLFARGAIDGAWSPEPYASQLVLEYGAHRLIDEADLWPEGKFPTTVLAVSRSFLQEHPQTVQRLVDANAQAIAWLNTTSDDEQVAGVQAGMHQANGTSLDEDVLRAALGQVYFDPVPLTSTFDELVTHAVDVGIGSPGDVSGLVDSTWVKEQR
ncbi:ABC transporter substrate-binding protein [Glutamicibacter sp. MNS18]|uniref:ABC transporter substrate-binding protein n=1 Tax=Glutamicibacter sp. MNS18 TaxID=2989817 RepID=UPI0022354EED|nr:ABC transporter substrate-binding protein [Glutamicibacter sp. MNS18]MCW4466102.1 ABC transporter substrate-binding protein [Glutamicibacter sp. MNS18]